MKKTLSTITVLSITAQSAFAEAIIIPPVSGLPGPTAAQQGSSIRTWFTQTLLPGWAAGLVGFVGAVALIMLVASGIRYLTAYTNEEAATGAKKMMIYSIVGLLLSVFSYTIVAIIANLKI